MKILLYSLNFAPELIGIRKYSGELAARLAAKRDEVRVVTTPPYYRLPLRPVLKFLLLYIGKRGFLDGRAGLTYAMLQSIYEYFIALKTRELTLYK